MGPSLGHPIASSPPAVAICSLTAASFSAKALNLEERRQEAWEHHRAVRRVQPALVGYPALEICVMGQGFPKLPVMERALIHLLMLIIMKPR